MPRPIDGEILPAEHEYDNPDLSPKQFLLAIMRDSRLPISTRMDAAAKVSVFEHPRLAQVTSDMTVGARIIIEGGLPNLPGTNIIMPEKEEAKKTNGSGQP